MNTDASRTEQRQARLARLEELACALAERAHERAMAAEAEADFQSASKSFERLGRAARQCMALSARLERDAAHDAREQAKRLAREAQDLAYARNTRAVNRAARLIWTEAEGPEAEALEDELNALLDREIEAGALDEETIEDLVQRLCTQMGLGRPEMEVHRASPLQAPPQVAPERDDWNSA